MKNFSKVYSAELEGIDAKLIEVETDINVGLHSFNIVGLADKSLNEAKERVSSALKNSGVKPPTKENRKIVVNLAPADLKKTGSQYDLGIALGYLLATKQLKEFNAKDKIFVGELALDGALRPISGVLNIARMAKKEKFKELFTPKENAAEAAMVGEVKVFPVNNLPELILHLEARQVLESQPKTKVTPSLSSEHQLVDIADIKGQENAKRALMIAAAGGPNLFMSGSPGAGKTMLAQALNSVLPAPDLEEIMEATQIYSAAGLLHGNPFINWRPFRAPHQTASPVAVFGGGQNPRPGEISLAHRGVLFLDELPEFRRDLLEALRQPMESGEITVSRIKNNLTYPARFTLVAAMNPCPCGYYGDQEKECRCSAYEVFKYQKKISGPLLDRIDIKINVPRTDFDNLKGVRPVTGESLKTLVKNARGLQRKRFGENKLDILTNAELSSKNCDELIHLTDGANKLLKEIFEKSLLSGRGYYRLLKTALTIADLEEKDEIEASHIAEAFQLRVRET